MKDFFIYKDGVLIGKLSEVIEANLSDKLNNYSTIEITVTGKEPLIKYFDNVLDLIYLDEFGRWKEYHINTIDKADQQEGIYYKLYCEQSLQELMDNIIIDDREEPLNKDPSYHLAYILNGSRWQVGNVEEGIYNKSYTNDLVGMNSLEALYDLVNSYNCEFEVRFETNNVNKITKRFIDLKKTVGRDLSKIFDINKDMLTILQTTDITNTKSCIYPYSIITQNGVEGEESQEIRVTIENVEWSVANGDPVDKPLGSKVLVNPDMSKLYSRYDEDRKITSEKMMSAQFENQPDPEVLVRQAWGILNTHNVAHITYELTAIDLFAITQDVSYAHESVSLGDICSVVDKNFEKPIIITTRVVERQLDLLNPINSTFVLGQSKKSIINDI